MKNEAENSKAEQESSDKSPAVTHTVLKTPANISAIAGLRPSDNPITTCDLSMKEDSADDVYPAAQAFWQMTLSKLETMPEDETLYVFLGEIHTAPSHKMTQMAILSLASAWRDAAAPDENRNFIYARELRYNELTEMAKYYKIDVPEEAADALIDSDTKGALVARALWANSPLHFAPLSSNQLFAHSLKKDIPLVLTDCAINNTYSTSVLKWDDPVWPEAADLLGRKKSELTYHLPNTQPSGVAWRNASMVLRGEEAARKHKARLVIQQGGNSHVCGYRNYSYKDSWLALQKKAGHSALGLFMSDDTEQSDLALKTAAKEGAEEDIMVIRNLETEMHTGDNRRKEQVYLDCLRQAFSGPADYLPSYQEPPSPEMVKKELEQAIEKALAKLPQEKSFPIRAERTTPTN